MYINNNAIATPGKTRQLRGTRSEGKKEAENILEISYWNNSVIEDEFTAKHTQFFNF